MNILEASRDGVCRETGMSYEMGIQDEIDVTPREMGECFYC